MQLTLPCTCASACTISMTGAMAKSPVAMPCGKITCSYAKWQSQMQLRHVAKSQGQTPHGRCTVQYCGTVPCSCVMWQSQQCRLCSSTPCKVVQLVNWVWTFTQRNVQCGDIHDHIGYTEQTNMLIRGCGNLGACHVAIRTVTNTLLMSTPRRQGFPLCEQGSIYSEELTATHAWCGSHLSETRQHPQHGVTFISRAACHLCHLWNWQHPQQGNAPEGVACRGQE